MRTYTTSKGAEISYAELNPGYICAVSQGILGKLENALVVPRTELDHFFMLYHYDFLADDWIIIESIAKGVSIGWLSWYTKLTPVHIYRPNDRDSDNICLLAATNAIAYGRRYYDFPTMARVAYITLHEIFKQLMKGKRPWVSYTCYPAVKDNAVICTELVAQSFRKAGYNVFNPYCLANPPNFISCLVEGIVEEVGVIPPTSPNRFKMFMYRLGASMLRESISSEKRRVNY